MESSSDIDIETDVLDMDFVDYLKSKYFVEIWKSGGKIHIRLS
jgi:hypothetical protein|nr:hypothetical protein [Prevotella sp.]